MKRLFTVAVTFLVLFMVGSTIVALVQEDLDMGWWWVVPIAGVFVLLLVIFRVSVQLSAEAAARADREADEAEAAAAAAAAAAEEAQDRDALEQDTKGTN